MASVCQTSNDRRTDHATTDGSIQYATVLHKERDEMKNWCVMTMIVVGTVACQTLTHLDRPGQRAMNAAKFKVKLQTCQKYCGRVQL